MAAENANIRPGDTVAVFGAGPVGLFAMKSARQFFGAGRVIAIDKVPYRLALAEQAAGAEPVDFTQVPDIVAYLKDVTAGRGPDSCIDAVGLEADGSPNQRLLGGLMMQAGSAIAFAWALNAVRPAGTVSVVGVYGPPWNHYIPLGWAMNRNVTVRMAQTPVLRYLDELMARSVAGEIDPSFLVSHELPLDEAPHGYEIFEQKRDGAVKILLHP
jgi:threonine dehydrogenase-like Zn-dependent dehydrogenase